MYPRSVHEKYLGIVQLGRTIDKAKMVANNTIGDFRYDAMDQALFDEFGIDGMTLSAIATDAVRHSSHVSNFEAYVKPLVEKKTQLEVQRFNREMLERKPTGVDLTRFDTQRVKIAPERTDITSWADLFDLQEGRSVPSRQRETTR